MALFKFWWFLMLALWCLTLIGFCGTQNCACWLQFFWWVQVCQNDACHHHFFFISH
jgi:hypothetical protein